MGAFYRDLLRFFRWYYKFEPKEMLKLAFVIGLLREISDVVVARAKGAFFGGGRRRFLMASCATLGVLRFWEAPLAMELYDDVGECGGIFGAL